MNRNTIFSVMFILCVVSLGYCQGNWELLHPQVTANQMVSLDFIDDQTGLAVGEVGSILKTMDGGDSWRIIPIPWTANLTDVDFVTPDIAYIIGESGVILKSTDAGESWALRPIDFTNTLNRVCFYNADEGWIVGNTGLILRTTNGGETWKRIITSYQYKWTGLASLNRNTWILIGAGLTVLRTEDSGSSWQNIFIEVYNSAVNDEDDYIPQDIYFLNSRIGWIAGRFIKHSGSFEGFLYKTTDGGRSWESVLMLETQHVLLDGGGSGKSSSPMEVSGGIQQIYFENEMKGVCLSGPAPLNFSTNLLYHTENGGETWCCRMDVTRLRAGASGRFRFLTPNKAICTYSGRGFINSIDGGRHWQGNDFWQKVPPYLIIENNGKLTALGSECDVSLPCDEMERGAIVREFLGYRSTDYGKTWAKVWPKKILPSGMTLAPDKNMNIIRFRQSDHAWGVEKLDEYYYALYESPDGGLTWNYQKNIYSGGLLTKGSYAKGDTLIQLGFLPDKVISVSKYIFTVMVSYDGGVNSEMYQFPDIWNEITPTCFYGNCIYENQISGYHFFSTQHWVVVGSDGNIVITTDEGKSWQNIPSGVIDNLQDIWFVNQDIGFVVGDFGRILKTEDGGLTWRKTNSGTQNNVYSIIFEDELTGWAGTSRGLLYTLDGGESWAPVTGQSINGTIGTLKYDKAGNLYGYFLPYWGKSIIISQDMPVPDGMLCVKKAETSSVEDHGTGKVEQFQLYPNYPNPFNSNTMIKYDLKQAGEIELAIYNIQGKRVRQLESGYCTAGSHTVRWDGRDRQRQVVSSGVYVIRLTRGREQQSVKMLYLQ